MNSSFNFARSRMYRNVSPSWVLEYQLNSGYIYIYTHISSLCYISIFMALISQFSIFISIPLFGVLFDLLYFRVCAFCSHFHQWYGSLCFTVLNKAQTIILGTMWWLWINRVVSPTESLPTYSSQVHSCEHGFQQRCNLYIRKKKSGKYVGGVGIEEEGHQILVPWQERWRFRASAVVEVGYIKAKGTLDVWKDG